MLKVDFDLGPLLSKIDRLEATIKESIRPAAKAGAQTFYEEVQARALSVGGFGLQAAVYQKFVVNSATGALGDSATYHVSWRKQREKTNVKGVKGAGLPYSTIGFWMEFGRWQRYMAVTDKNGDWVTVARPEMVGKPKPKRGASQAEKDAYWMPRKGGPVFHGPRPFLRISYDSHKAIAAKASNDRMAQLIKEKAK